jgi:segregation and condensation protein A
VTENEILIKIDRFDGPLALLLHLIQKEEMRIQELDLTTITNQYLDYLQKMQDLNFDVAGEYLFMAATLLYLKSQTVADESQDQNLIKITAGEMGLEIQTRGELIKRLEELERFQRLGQKLWGLPKKGHEIFVHPKIDRKAIENSILTPIDLQQLTETMMDLIRREKKRYAVVKRDRLSIKEKLVRLKAMLKQGETTQFDKLLDEHETGIIDKVITFISLLELARLKKLQIFQNEDKGNIYIEVKESLESFDPETANGFDPEGETINAPGAPVPQAGAEMQDPIQ